MTVPSSCLGGTGSFMTRRRLNARMRTRLSMAGSSAICSSVSPDAAFDRTVASGLESCLSFRNRSGFVAKQEVVEKVGSPFLVRTIERRWSFAPLARAEKISKHRRPRRTGPPKQDTIRAGLAIGAEGQERTRRCCD